MFHLLLTYVDPLQPGRRVVDGDVHQGVTPVQGLPRGVHILQLGLREHVVTDLLGSWEARQLITSVHVSMRFYTLQTVRWGNELGLGLDDWKCYTLIDGSDWKEKVSKSCDNIWMFVCYIWHNIISDVFLLEAVSTGPVSMGHCLSGWGLSLAFIVMLPAPATRYPGKCRNTGALRNAWRTLQHIKGVLSNPAHKILWPRIWKCIPYNNATLRYINFIKRADSKREIEWLVQPENETR